MKIVFAASILTLLLRESVSFSVGSPSRIKAVHHNNEKGESTTTTTTTISKRQVFQNMGQVVLERSDTLRSAGFYDKKSDDHLDPLVAGAKTNIILFCLALGYKWYRSIFINKLAIWERQPQWNTVITSKEDEEKANLEAMTCKTCGSTIFIAKGRKWFQMPKGYTCYCCGATGEDAFTNTRGNILEEIDDDSFDYEKPLDFVTAAERRKLMKQAGGDEAKANELLTKGAQALEESTATGAEAEDAEAPKKKKKKKGKKKKKTEEHDDSTPVASNDSGEKESKQETDEVEKPTSDDDVLDFLDEL